MAESVSLLRPSEIDISESSSNNNHAAANKYLEHNQKVLGELNLGDLIEYKRNLYSNWAIYIGKNKVIHLHNDECQEDTTSKSEISRNIVKNARVVISNYFDVVKDSLAYRNNSADQEMEPLPVQQILTRAFEQVDTQRYNLFSYDSEKFAKSCRYGPDVGCYSTPINLLTIGYRVTRNLKKMHDACVDFLNRKSATQSIADEKDNKKQS
jgi:hypothetical protein